MVGQTLGHYKILEMLGAGGMGEVYLAEDSTLKRRVALKVLPTDLASSRERLERFQREAESLAALNHPNIVHVYTVEEDDGVHFLTMELVEGETLDQVISSEGLSLEQFFELAVPLADALSEAHDRGIVHRDLKPANVMVDRRGRPKILDFGLAKLRLPERSAEFSEMPTEVMTEEGKVLGTYPYMSPEQVEGKAVDHRSDIFSLGTLLYEMATGHRPFRGDSPASLMSAILRDRPSEVDVEREELPHHLGRIISRCLEKDTDDRYQRARDLTKDLDELRQEVQTGVRSAPRPTVVQAARRSWGLRAVIGALVIVVAAIALFVTQPWEKPPPTGPRITSLAVLPLENLSGDPEQDYYAAGITEGLIADLGRIAALRVISRQSVMRYKDSDLPLPEIAKQLGVEALIEGSVLPVGDRVRVTAQLVQANPEQHLWADTYDRDAKDILALLSEVTRSIAAEVQVALSPQEKARLASTSEVNPEAHRAYLRGRHFISIQSPESLERALEQFRVATEIDPTFGQAWVGLGEYYANLATWVLPVGAEEVRAEALAKAYAAIERALEIDQSLAQAHVVLGMLLFYLDWDWPAVEEQFRLAIDLEPSDSTAHTSYAEFLSAMGRHDEALEEALMAERLDPLSPRVGAVLGDTLRWAGKFEAAIDQYQKTLEWNPHQIAALVGLGSAYVESGREEEAVETWQRFQGLFGNDQLVEAFEGKSLDEVNRIWLEYALQSDTPMVGPGDLAEVYAELGEYEKTIEYLEIAFETRGDPGKNPSLSFVFLKVNPRFKPLHSDPRFQDLLSRMNFPE